MTSSQLNPEPGTQTERTALAWRRTGAALIGAGLVQIKLWSLSSAWAATVTAGALIAIAAWVSWSSSRRYRSAHTAFWAGLPLADGRLAASMCLIVLMLGANSVVAILMAN